MSTYSYTANSTPQQSAALLTGKIGIETTTPIQYAAGFRNETGTGNITAGVGAATVVGNATAVFTTQLVAGYWIGNVTGTTIGVVASIQDNGNLTLTANAAIAVTDEGFTFNSYGVPGALVNANSEIIPANNSVNSIIVTKGGCVSFLNVVGVAGPFTVTELGMP